MVGAGRRGINMIGLVLMVLALVGIGLGLMNLSQQAGRSGHWFHHAQLAYDVADAGLKQALYRLVQANSAAAASAQAAQIPALVQIANQISGGQAGGPYTLLDSAGGNLPGGLAALVKKLTDQRMTVTLRVELTVGAARPLWSGAPDGVPANPVEKRGAITVVSSATVKSPVGIAVDRRITLEREYKVITLPPPVLGRFSLFVQGSPANPDEPNAVPMQYDQSKTGATAGNATVGAAYPLVLESPFKDKLVNGTSPVALDRVAFTNAISDPAFLDKQGWVYLGDSGAGGWKLKLAHGFGECGESPLLPGYIPTSPTGCGSDTAGFNQRYGSAFTSFLSGGGPANLHLCQIDLSQPEHGLYSYWHGFAENYEAITIKNPNRLGDVQNSPGSRKPAMDFGDGKTSCFRLFGDATACSPTLVFGPVVRQVMQRSHVLCDVLPDVDASGYTPCGDPVADKECDIYQENKNGPNTDPILNTAFGSSSFYKSFGTAVYEQSWMQGLPTVLSAKGSGDYGPDGMLTQNNTSGTDKTLTSQLFPKISTVVPGKELPADVEKDLAGGTLACDAYQGQLANAFGSFGKVIEAKCTYQMRPAAYGRLMYTAASKSLKVPGVVVIGDETPLKIDEVQRIDEGGILVNHGPISIAGNIVRGTPAPPPPGGAALPPEPLTLVALKGDITIGAGVNTIEAVLVALDGAVKFPTSDVLVDGGVTCAKLDVKSITGGGKHRIRYSDLTDPTGSRKSVWKIYYGGTDKVMVSGFDPTKP